MPAAQVCSPGAEYVGAPDQPATSHADGRCQCSRQLAVGRLPRADDPSRRRHRPCRTYEQRVGPLAPLGREWSSHHPGSRGCTSKRRARAQPACVGPLRGIAFGDEGRGLLPRFFAQEWYQTCTFSFRRVNQLLKRRCTHLAWRKAFPIRAPSFDELRKLSVFGERVRLLGERHTGEEVRVFWLREKPNLHAEALTGGGDAQVH